MGGLFLGKVMQATAITEWALKNKAILMVGLVLSATALYLAFDVNYKECEDKNNCLTVAFEVQDTYLIWDKNPQHLADKLSTITGMDVEIYPVTDSGAAIEAVDKGNADIAFMDGAAAWLALSLIHI